MNIARLEYIMPVIREHYEYRKGTVHNECRKSTL